MSHKSEKDMKREIIEIGRRLYEKDFAGATAGNISVRAAENIYITKHAVCLGFLKEEDILELDLSGRIIKGEGGVSAEAPMHLEIYKNLDTQCVIHSHPIYTNGYFAVQDKFKATTFEAQLILGDVAVIEQNTPTVTDIAPVIESLKIQNIVVLKNHGVVAIGDCLTEAFSLTELLEDSVRIKTIAKIWQDNTQIHPVRNFISKGINTDEKIQISTDNIQTRDKFKLFSPEHIKEIVRLINEDKEIARLGEELDLTCSLAIKMEDVEQVYNIKMERGKIIRLTNDENADFMISGKKEIWEAVFSRRLDPFQATMQKKLKLKGDFAKLSKWYAPFYRIFDVWKKVSVE